MSAKPKGGKVHKKTDPDFKINSSKKKVYTSSSSDSSSDESDKHPLRKSRKDSYKASSSSDSEASPPRRVAEYSPGISDHEPASPVGQSPAHSPEHSRSRSPHRPKTPDVNRDIATSNDQSRIKSNANGNNPVAGPSRVKITPKVTSNVGVSLPKSNTWHSISKMKIPRITNNGNQSNISAANDATHDNGVIPEEFSDEEKSLFSNIYDNIVRQVGLLLANKKRAQDNVVSRQKKHLIIKQSTIYRRAFCIQQELKRALESIPAPLRAELAASHEIRQRSYTVNCDHRKDDGSPLPCKGDDYTLTLTYDLSQRFGKACSLLVKARDSEPRVVSPPPPGPSVSNEQRALMSQLEEEVKKLQEVVKGKDEELQHQSMTLMDNDNKISSLINTNQQLKQELEEMKSKVSRLESDKSHLEMQVNFMNQAKEALDKKYDDSRTLIGKWEQSHKNLEQSCNGLKQTIELMKLGMKGQHAHQNTEQPESSYTPPPAKPRHLPQQVHKEYVPTPKRLLYSTNPSVQANIMADNNHNIVSSFQEPPPPYSTAATASSNAMPPAPSPGHNGLSPGHVKVDPDQSHQGLGFGTSNAGQGSPHTESGAAPGTPSINSQALPRNIPTYDPTNPGYNGNVPPMEKYGADDTQSATNPNNSPASENGDYLKIGIDNMNFD